MELKDVLLTDEEIRRLPFCGEGSGLRDDSIPAYQALAKAQCLKLIEWLEEPCHKHKYSHYGNTPDGKGGELPLFRTHSQCSECMAELKKQLEG
jgi:hypothetical protein